MYRAHKSSYKLEVELVQVKVTRRRKLASELRSEMEREGGREEKRKNERQREREMQYVNAPSLIRRV